MVKLFVVIVKAGALISFLALLLFSSAKWIVFPSLFFSTLQVVLAFFLDAATQWAFFVCFGLYITAFLILRFRTVSNQWRNTILLVYVLLNSTIYYAINYPSTQAITLLGGSVLGQGMAVWTDFDSRSQKSANRINFGIKTILLLVILIMLASVWHDTGFVLEYHSRARWSGPWDNPNIFGLLMGAGGVLVTGIALGGWKMAYGGGKTRSVYSYFVSRITVVMVLCFMAAIFMGRGLLHSYSRGAWLAASCGMIYLAWYFVRAKSHFTTTNNSFAPQACDHPFPSDRLRKHGAAESFSYRLSDSWVRRSLLLFFVIMVSAFVLILWYFQSTEWRPAQRALSAVNSADFSWRNRIAAWEADLQIMAEHPWFGTGWDQPVPIYEHYYLPPKLNESAAIETNDYLLLGATLGIPAFSCFGIYLWLSLTWKSAGAEVDWLQTTCRAGAIVLLVGFWFDGGLFKLPTAATFWILLELGSAGNREICEPREND